ncbi:MAG: tRNA adenosine(34) deaminase TadA [Nitrospirota bacterium]|nr:tRNA adenosine(34) deaminase TadA [Nitrospirota bacterium]
MRHETFMRLALEEAQRAADLDEVPIGAVAVLDGEVIAADHNRRETDQDPTGHAELLVIRKAAQRLGRWRLSGVTLYVTIEPCLMCAGALVLARVDRVVFGASDPKAGALVSLYDIQNDVRLNHRFEVLSGILEPECRSVIQGYFRKKRDSNQ